MSAWFETKEQEAEAAIQHLDPEQTDGSEAFDHFMDEVGIFWEQYWYQLASSVTKDAFTLFEVFLEESANEILRCYGSNLKSLSTEDSWRMPQCDDFYRDYLGFPIFTETVEDLQWIRNKLAHLRNELRTTTGKEEFSQKLTRLGLSEDANSDEAELRLPHFDYGRELAFTKSLVLSPLEAWIVLNLLRKIIENHTLVFHDIKYGGASTQALDDLQNGRPVNERDRRLIHIPAAPEP